MWKLPNILLFGQIPESIRKLVSRVVEMLAKYLAGPDCGEEAVGYMHDDEVGGGIAELASGRRVDDDAFLAWSCESWKKKGGLFAVDGNGCMCPW